MNNRKEDQNRNDHEEQTHYLPIYMCLGISVGVAIGTALDNIGVGMCLGVGIGTCLGAVMDAANRKKTNEDSGSDEKNDQDPME